VSTLAIDTANLIRQHNGVYPGDEHLPPIVLLVEYDNAWGGVGYGTVREGELNRYAIETHWVRNPRVWWRRTEA
jgi:hypothetical protein